jgi:hypothetical protein
MNAIALIKRLLGVPVVTRSRTGFLVAIALESQTNVLALGR